MKYFVDTNILVYLFSQDDSPKREACKAFLKQASANGSLVLSAQVMGEFSAVMLRKYNMPPNHVKAVLDDLNAFEVLAITAAIVKKAVDIHLLNQLSFWDSQIVSAALSANCTAIISEDLNAGQKIQGVEIVNPMRIN